MTLVDVSHETGRTGEQLRTVECALCEAEYGTDYERFSFHLLNNHTPADLALAPVQTTGISQVVSS